MIILITQIWHLIKEREVDEKISDIADRERFIIQKKEGKKRQHIKDTHMSYIPLQRCNKYFYIFFYCFNNKISPPSYIQ